MADFRNIFTRIWNDKWFSKLQPDEKLLFIYLFSNERSSVCGMYELPFRTIVFETGINNDRVIEILSRFEKDKKVYYSDEIIWVVNFKKYNNSGNSAKVKIRIMKDLEILPNCEIKKMYYLYEKIPYPKQKIPYPEKFHDTDTDTEEDKEKETDTISTSAIYSAYQNNIGGLSGIISEKINADIEEYSANWVMEAIEKATAMEKRSLSYIEGTLKGWKRDGKSTGKKVKYEPILRKMVHSDGTVEEVLA